MNFISSVGWKVWTSEQLIKVCLFSQSSFIFIWWYLHNKPPTSQHREVAQMNNGRWGRWYKHYNEIQYFWYNAKHIWLWVWTRSEPCVVTILGCCSHTTHNILSRLICHVWFWPYMVRQSTKLSLYMAYQSTNKCWASVPPQYHPSGPWGSLDQSQTWFTERKPVKKSRQTTNKIFAKKEYFLMLQENFYYSAHMWARTL